MAKAGDGKKTAELGYTAEAKAFYNNFILDANDEFNRIQDQRIQERLKLDQYDDYTEQELLRREAAIKAYDKSYGSFEQGLEYIDRAAQTAFDQEYLGYQQNLRGIQTDFDNLQRQNSRDQLQAAYSTANLNLQLDNLDLDIDNQQLTDQILDLQLANNQIAGEEILRQSQRLKIEDQNRRTQYGVQMNEQSLQMQKQASEARLSMLTETLKGQASAGTAAASGRRGKSAKAAISTATTLSSINSQAVADNLMRGNDSFKNAVTGLTSQNQSAEQISASNQESLAGQLKQNQNQGEVIKNTKKQTQNKISQLKNNKQSVQNNIDEVAAMLGITQEQFEADSETLSQMYADQLPAFENIVERISNSVYKDKTNLFNKMPLPPQFAALADAPYEVPMAGVVPRTLLDPNQYDSDQFAIPKPPSGGGTSGIGALAGGVLAVGITALTGGLGAPIAAALPVATGAFGLGSQAGNLLEGVFNY